MKNQQVQDLKKIMSWDNEEMACLLSKVAGTDAMNPWIRQLPEIFRCLRLKKAQIVLDVPCGNGRVSIPLAKKYGVKVLGYDILPEYVKAANRLAKQENVSDLCMFEVEDIRNIVKKKDCCNLLLWIAAPTIWKNAKETIKMLRKCVKANGRIIIADAYLYSTKGKKVYPDYELLEDMNKGYTFFGDKIERFINYKDTLWDADYARCKKSTRKLLNQFKEFKDKKVIEHRLSILNKEEKTDKKYLGLGIWIIQVNK